MMMKKKNNTIQLVNLYINYIFSKTTIIILSISLILMTLALILISNPSLDKADYLLGYNIIHLNYFRLGILIIQVFNSVIITTIIITVIINSASFDSLFISNNPRYIICLSKLLAMFIIMILISLFEFIILYLIPLIHYPLYKPLAKEYLVIFYLLIIDFFEISLSVLLSTLVSSIFIPMAVLFISIIFKVICQSVVSFKNSISYFIPILEEAKYGLDGEGIMVGVIWVILLIFLYFSVYNVRDLKQM